MARLDPALVWGRMVEDGTVPAGLTTIYPHDVLPANRTWKNLTVEGGTKPSLVEAQAVWTTIEAEQATEESEKQAIETKRQARLGIKINDNLVVDPTLKTLTQSYNDLLDIVNELHERLEKRGL